MPKRKKLLRSFKSCIVVLRLLPPTAAVRPRDATGVAFADLPGDCRRGAGCAALMAPRQVERP
ncbi:hypothetical protein DB459_14945 [Bradyrhizobium sp. WD16]|nr:hypothetical protein DB459_14945 [Bradyrhizobium sp. WD16]